MRHVIATRFSVPRPHDPVNSGSHADAAWLDRRLGLFRSYFIPSIIRFEVPVVLLCSTASAPIVRAELEDHSWAQVVVQDEWHGGWSGEADQIVTRMDSDDAIHLNWFAALEAAQGHAEVFCTKEFLRYDVDSLRLCRYKRREPSPLAAFRAGINPFGFDHATLQQHFRTQVIKGPHLLQIFHGGNVSSRQPSWYRLRLSLDRLSEYGVE